MATLHLATFTSDATPPAGHPLCGGWIEPVRGIDDPLELVGIVLLGQGAPIVLAALDWCGVRNQANILWRKALAEAAHTVPENVALHCVHPHNAPFADVEAQRLIESVPGAPPSLDLKFYERAVRASAAALRESLKNPHRFTHLGTGQAKVDQVASNRRVLGPDGKVKFTRTSATKDPAARAEPEGLIDPYLKTLSLWDNERPLAALHYYATHPMSYYGDGRVSADFCGLARRKRQAEDERVFQMYFIGCAGNVTEGMYNERSKVNRPILRDRIQSAMVEDSKATKKSAIDGWTWRVEPVKLPPRKEAVFGEDESRKALNDEKATKAKRGNAALQLSWLKRKGVPIEISCLDFGPALVLHLPGEPFIEYQLRAQKQKPDSFVCVAGYGDDGPGYLPTRDAYFQGGYEPTVALTAPEGELLLHAAMDKVMGKK